MYTLSSPASLEWLGGEQARAGRELTPAYMSSLPTLTTGTIEPLLARLRTGVQTAAFACLDSEVQELLMTLVQAVHLLASLHGKDAPAVAPEVEAEAAVTAANEAAPAATVAEPPEEPPVAELAELDELDARL